MQPTDFMLRHKSRTAATQPNAPANGRPALLRATVPPQGRWALPGERPPSKYAPGEPDAVIEKYDIYARAYWAGAVNRHAR